MNTTDICNLLAQAKAKTGIKSNLQLAKRIGVDDSNLIRWERGHTFPTDQVLVDICKLAGADSKEHLLKSRARRESGEAGQIWESLLEDYERQKYLQNTSKNVA